MRSTYDFLVASADPARCASKDAERARRTPWSGWGPAANTQHMPTCTAQADPSTAVRPGQHHAVHREGVPYGEYQESRIRLFHQILDRYMADDPTQGR